MSVRGPEAGTARNTDNGGDMGANRSGQRLRKKRQTTKKLARIADERRKTTESKTK